MGLYEVPLSVSLLGFGIGMASVPAEILDVMTRRDNTQT